VAGAANSPHASQKKAGVGHQVFREWTRPLGLGDSPFQFHRVNVNCCGGGRADGRATGGGGRVRVNGESVLGALAPGRGVEGAARCLLAAPRSPPEQRSEKDVGGASFRLCLGANPDLGILGAEIDEPKGKQTWHRAGPGGRVSRGQNAQPSAWARRSVVMGENRV